VKFIRFLFIMVVGQMMKSTLLFIHGAGGNHTVWGRQIEIFKDSVAIDLPGHGVGVERTTVDEYVEDVREFCDKRHLKNIVMVGILWVAP
jgi:pimeloyl-ACP methyl ester carboxylesterase